MFRRENDKNKNIRRYNDLVEIINFKIKLFYEKYKEDPNVIFVNYEHIDIFRKIFLTSQISRIYGLKIYIDNNIKSDYDIKVMLEYERSNYNATEIRSTKKMGK